MFQEVETSAFNGSHLNTDFTKPSRGCCFFVVVSEFILRRNQRALLCVGKKDVLHFNKSNVKFKKFTYLFIGTIYFKPGKFYSLKLENLILKLLQ